jgi:hypothetical protein
MSRHLVRNVKKIRSVVRRHPRGVPPNAELTEPQLGVSLLDLQGHTAKLLDVSAIYQRLLTAFPEPEGAGLEKRTRIFYSHRALFCYPLLRYVARP